MSFDLNGWYFLARNTENLQESEKYYQLWKSAKAKFLKEYVMFTEKYRLNTYSCDINKAYLKMILPKILTGKIFIPTEMSRFISREYSEYLKNNYPEKHLDNLFKGYRTNGWSASVLNTGLKKILRRYEGFDLSPHELLMFEVWEFTLTYPEFKELFVEEWN